MLRGLARSGRRMLHVESAGCVFDVGAAAHPHPRKAAAGLPGEDAYFIASRQAGQVALGVGDGVGGAGDSGRFSRDLMEQAEGAYSSAEYAVSADAHPFEPRAILDLAYARTRDRVVVHRANGNGRNFRDQSISSESQAAFSRSDRQATQTAEEEIRARRGVSDWTRATRLLRRLASSY